MKTKSPSQRENANAPVAKVLRDPASEHADLVNVTSPKMLVAPRADVDTSVTRGVLGSAPSFLFSLLLHFLILIAAAFWLLPDLPALVTADLTARPAEHEDIAEIEETIEFQPEIEVDQEIVDFEMQPETELVTDEVSFSPAADLDSAPPAEVAIMDFGSDMAPMDFQSSSHGFDGGGLTGRGQASRTVMVRKGGGNDASETAVALGLAWLAEHQNPNGTWTFDHRYGACNGRCRNPGTLSDAASGGTAMALLPYLGAGQTHIAGEYQQTVGRGLAALVQQAKLKRNQGASFMDSGNMYSHGIASMVLCEAYAMTDDPALAEPAQLAINYISYAQGPRGGWRYKPREAGDTSVVGWQVMALKSGHMAFLNVMPVTVQGAHAFLDYAAVDGGSGYSYGTPESRKYKPSTTAIGLLCRMYLGWKKENEALRRGITRIANEGPSKGDYYYNYYATQALFQFTNGEGKLWREWNDKMRDQLVTTQAKQGHERGSWFVPGTGHTDRAGGRLCKTSLATMTLEVYYRHMPIYRTDAVETEFPE